MSTPLLGGNHQVKRMSQVQHGSFIRSFFSTHPMNAVKASTTGLNGLRNKLSIMSARATSHKKHYLLVYSKYSPHMMDSPSHDYGTPPPQSLLPTPQSQDMSLFDFEGSTNHFKSLVISDDERFSDGLNVWEFTPTQTAEMVDFSLTQLANNSSAEDIRGNDLAVPETKMDGVADCALLDETSWKDGEEMLDESLMVKELEELNLGPGVSSTDNPGNEEEDTIPDVFALNETATSLNVAKRTDAKNEDVDSALAWSALSFL
jgi:hypothetical protein